MNVDLVIIDPQVDFCDPAGALFVSGAESGAVRLASFIDRVGAKLNDIHVTMDSHHFVDVAHPIYWKNSKGDNPAPFTIITVKDVENGTWMTTIPSLAKRALDYVKSLETNGRYPLCIWPPHCLIGTPGHNVVGPVEKALRKWEYENVAIVDYVTKGSNPHTEHYSGVKADVPDPADPSTQLNRGLIKTLENADKIAFAGWASSHCLANTMRDIADAFSSADFIKKMVLLTNATSPVPGFENFADSFVAEMTAKGMALATTQDFLS